MNQQGLARNWEFPADRSRAESTAEALVAIASDRQVGQRLGTKEQLRQRIGVSSGTFNEAIRLTEAAGMIELRRGPGGGIFAARPSPLAQLRLSLISIRSREKDVADAYRVREALEPLLVQDAIDDAPKNTTDEMRAHVESMWRSFEKNDRALYSTANSEFHNALARASSGSLVPSLYLAMVDLIGDNTRAAVWATDGQEYRDRFRERVEVHEKLVDAIEAKDVDAAMNAVHEHYGTLWSEGKPGKP